jgi:predicted nucleic acid-binding protein
MISSESLTLEVSKNPDVERRERVMELLQLAASEIGIGEDEARRANELTTLGFGSYDALHLACAEAASVDVFLTTDMRSCGVHNGRRLPCECASPTR